MQGEREAAAWVARVWSLPWAMDGDYYRRTEHALRSLTGDALFAAAPWPRSVNVKACMLSRVPRAQQLFSTEEGASSMSLVPGFGGAPCAGTAVAVARFGEGLVAFVGDVNAEDSTAQVVAAIAKLPLRPAKK